MTLASRGAVRSPDGDSTDDDSMPSEFDVEPNRADGDERMVRIFAVLALILALLPIVVATIGGLRRGWIPIGDNALFQIRARDVFTRDHPLLGTWTSASHSLGVNVNNPGPLLFDLYALPAKINGTAGLAIGAALGNALSVLGIAAFARRRGGAPTVAAAMAMTAALLWTMGSELLFDPWQPHSLLLPFLFLLVLVWSMASGDLAALPWAVGVASLIVQTHLSYAVLLPLLVGVGVAGLVVVTATARRRLEGTRRQRHRRTTRRTVALAVVVAAICWVQPLVQQVAGPGRGNLGELATSVGKGDPPLGPALGARLVADVIGLAPFWARPSFATFAVLVERTRIPPLSSALAGLALVALALAVVTALGRRRRDTPTVAAGLVGLAAVAGALVTSSMLPLGEFGIAAHQFRWLWPIGVFVTFAVVATALRYVPVRVATGVALALTAGLAIANLPSYNIGYGPAADAASIPTVRALVHRIHGLDDQSPLLFDVRDLRFAEPYSVPVMAELQRQGIEFRVADDGLAAQVGSRRQISAPIGPRLVQREGDAAFVPPTGGRLVARVDGLTPTQRDELTTLRTAVTERITTVGLHLNADGRAIASLGALPAFSKQAPVAREADALIASGELTMVVRSRLIDIEPAWRTRFARFAELQERRDHRTVALFLVDGR